MRKGISADESWTYGDSGHQNLIYN